MSICLCDISALEAIRSSGRLLSELLECPRTSRLDGCVVPRPFELEDLLAGLGLRSRPVHLLVPDGGSTRGRPGIVRHRRRAPLPRGALIKASRDVRIAGPELVLCQLAARGDFDLVDVARIAYELCGTYLLDEDPDSWKGFVNNDVSATTVHRIESMALALGRERGIGILREALPFVVDGARSPMETVLAMLLTLPRRLGGFGLAGLALNYEVRGIDRKIDVAYPDAMVGLEYKGRDYHAIEQSGRDDRRQNEIVGRGWTILNVWHEDLVDDLKFRGLQDSLFRALGRRVRLAASFETKQNLLRSRLVPGLRGLA